MMKDDVLCYLAQGDGYDGILDIYTDDKDILCHKVTNSIDQTYHVPSDSICDKYHINYGGSIQVYPMSELPEDRKEYPVDSELLSHVRNKPWILE